MINRSKGIDQIILGRLNFCWLKQKVTALQLRRQVRLNLLRSVPSLDEWFFRRGLSLLFVRSSLQIIHVTQLSLQKTALHWLALNLTNLHFFRRVLTAPYLSQLKVRLIFELLSSQIAQFFHFLGRILARRILLVFSHKILIRLICSELATTSSRLALLPLLCLVSRLHISLALHRPGLGHCGVVKSHITNLFLECK